MKVLYVIPGLGTGGGAERSLAAMAPILTRHLELNVAFLSDRDGLVPVLEDAGVSVTRVRTTNRLATISALHTLVNEQKPDLVHTTLWEADVTGRLASVLGRVPVSSSLVNVVYGRRHLASPQLKPWRVRASQAADLLSARSVVRFHAISEEVKKVMSRRLLIPRSRIDVVPRGRAPEDLGKYSTLRRDRGRSRLGVGNEPVVMAIARHNWQKGLDLVVRAAPAVLEQQPGTRFFIGGPEADCTPLLEQLIQDLGLEEAVELIGRRDDVTDLMCAADAYCVPSRWEGFGGILVEAMALGTPTVGTNIGTTLEIAGPNPWLEIVPPDDPDCLADGLLKVLGDPTWRTRHGPLGRRRFLDHYTADIVAHGMLEFFQRALVSSRLSGSQGPRGGNP